MAQIRPPGSSSRARKPPSGEGSSVEAPLIEMSEIGHDREPEP